MSGGGSRKGSGRSGPPPHRTEALETTYEEARRVVKYQLDHISDLDDKAAHTVRILVLLFGLLLTGISVVVRAVVENGETIDGNAAESGGQAAMEFVNVYTTGGVILLLVSFFLAIWAYSETNTQPGLGPVQLRKLDVASQNKAERLEDLLVRFPEWMVYNETSIGKDSTLLFYCHACMFLGIVSLILGVVVNLPFDASQRVLAEPLSLPIPAIVAVLGAFTIAAGIADVYDASILETVADTVQKPDRWLVLVVLGTLLLLGGAAWWLLV